MIMRHGCTGQPLPSSTRRHARPSPYSYCTSCSACCAASAGPAAAPPGRHAPVARAGTKGAVRRARFGIASARRLQRGATGDDDANESLDARGDTGRHHRPRGLRGGAARRRSAWLVGRGAHGRVRAPRARRRRRAVDHRGRGASGPAPPPAERTAVAADPRGHGRRGGRGARRLSPARRVLVDAPGRAPRAAHRAGRAR